MNKIIKGVKDIESGYSMGNNEIQILCYADDATLFAQSEHDF